MKALTILLSLAVGSSAFAGIGGYTTINCISDSGRTFVSVYLGDEDLRMTVLVDGKSSVYDSDQKGISFDGNEQAMIIKKNKSIQVALTGQGAKRELIIQPGSDPRKGTDIDYVAKTDLQTIPVSCKSYTKEP